jgi:uncharacterized heparinase superfamily protein
VESSRIDEGGMQGFVASHDGYASRFGIIHERMITLRDGGHLLEGRDRFHKPDGGKPRDRDDAVSVRFHVHPDLEVLRDDHDRIALSAGNGEAWVFSCDTVSPVIEESIFFAGLTGPRRTLQIVLAFRASQTDAVRWRFTRTVLGRG